MEQERLKLCPIGIQTFSNIREEDYLYIDKTALVYRLTHDAAKYVFLSRPRRFGKSLLVSTLHSYFAGRSDLFRGLEIEKLEREWKQYPVLHFDMSLGKHLGKEELERYLGNRLAFHEKKYNIENPPVDANDRLTNLIIRAYEQTGEKVVVLIDEYDAPLLDVMHEEENLPKLRNVMRNFYSPLKACDPYLRFVFLTGITKFSQLSIFSELNNISNISMDVPYTAICGITEEELQTHMAGYIDKMANEMHVSHEEIVGMLKTRYDGYHFTWPSPDIYNPYSLLNAFAKNRLDNYWFGSGTPTYLIEMLRKFGILPSRIGGQDAMASEFDAPTERMTTIVPLLYQSGYITIKDYDAMFDSYHLDIPNNEVRIGLMKSLIPEYVMPNTLATTSTVVNLARMLYKEDMDGTLRLLQEFLLTVPQCDNTDYEGHYQQVLYIIFSLLGQFTDVEIRTPRGRIDMVMRTWTKLYVIELKMNKSAGAAMRQIDLKDYPQRFALCGLPVVKVGISFDSERRTIGEWTIE